MEDKHLKNTLDMLQDYDLSTIERIILASTDTVQSLMSVIFGSPVHVEVINQINDYGVIIRLSKLIICDGDDINVALAESIIPLDKNRTEFIGAMGDRNIGIGQAINKLGIFTQRRIIAVHIDSNNFMRTYVIRGDNIEIIITETFPRGLFDVR